MGLKTFFTASLRVSCTILWCWWIFVLWGVSQYLLRLQAYEIIARSLEGKYIELYGRERHLATLQFSHEKEKVTLKGDVSHFVVRQMADKIQRCPSASHMAWVS